MKENPSWDEFFSRLSWFLVVVLLFSTVSIFTFPQPGPGNPLSGLIPFIAGSIYAAIYLLQASFLAYAKWKNKDRMRKYSLFFIYLFGFFSSILALSLYGWHPRLIDNFLAIIISSLCWLYYKFKQEYITKDEFYENFKI